MLNVNISMTGEKNLEQHIAYIKKLILMKTDVSFQKFIQEKCLEIVIKKSRELLAQNTTTNEDLKSAYINNHKIKEEKDGFVIYNDLCVVKETTRFSEGYVFSVALAFEYGTGIVGSGSVGSAPPSYRYNVNNNHVKIDNDKVPGWWLSIEKNGNNQHFGVSKSGKAVVTQGYRGMEIYRSSAIEITKRLKTWVNEYFNKKEV